MLWLSVIHGMAPPKLSSTSRADPNTPYVFSVCIEGEVNSFPGGSYDFLIEGTNTKHYLQVRVLSGRIYSIDGLVVRKEQCAAYDSPYSEIGDELPEIPLFTLVPIAGGEAPRLSNSTVTQKTDVSISLYSDAVIISFDRFNIDTRFPVAEGCDVATSADGFLAALIFRDHLAELVMQKLGVPLPIH